MVAASIGTDVQGVVMSGPLILAVLISAAAGVLSFFSPCCLPLVPGYLSYVASIAGSDTSQGAASHPGNDDSRPSTPLHSDGTVAVARASPAMSTFTAPTRAAVAGSGATRRAVNERRREPSRSRTLLGAALFVAGFAGVFTSYGAMFGALGSILINYQAILIRVLGVLTIVLGLMFTGLFWKIPLAGRTFRLAYKPRVGLAGAPLLGVMFGLGWTPCIGPTLAAVLTLATNSADAGRGALLSLAYSIGLGLPFLIAAFSIQRAMTKFAWARRHAPLVMRVGGGFLVLLGTLQVTGLWSELIAQLQGLVSSWQPPL